MKKKHRVFCESFSKKLGVVVFLLVLTTVLFATNPTVNVYRLTYEGINKQSADSINDAIYSFTAEVKNYSIKDFRTQPIPADTSLLKSDFIFYGSIMGNSDGVKLNLVLKNVSANTTRLISKHYSNPNIILIESRSLVRDLFDTSSILESGSESTTQKSKHSPTDITGRWNGGSGIKSITLLPNSRGIIVLESGASISVITKLVGKTLTVTQKSSVSAKQFADLPDELAKEASQNAKPLKWILTLSDDMNVLTGTKTEVVIAHNGKKITEIKSVTVPASWTRE